MSASSLTKVREARTARIAFIMPRHSHDDARVAHKEAWTLQDRGYDVVLLCKHAPVSEYLGMRVFAARAGAQGLLRPFLNLPSLARQALELKADLYLLVNPDTLLLGVLLTILGKRIIYSTQEDFLRKVEIHPNIPRVIAKLVGGGICAGEHLLARISSATIATQPNVHERYAPHAILAVNAPLTEGPVASEARRLSTQLPYPALPTLVYAGRISRDRGLCRMLDLLAGLNEIRPWRMKLMGEFLTSADRNQAHQHRAWPWVEYLGVVPHAVSLAHIRQSDIGLAILDDVGGYSRTSITKLYEYMLMETPFVASDFREWRESIEDVPAGLFVDGLNSAELTRLVDELLADRQRYEMMRTAGRTYIEQRFNWHIVSEPIQEAVSRQLQSVAAGAR
ncbi:MAG TPA: glycosyltransferase [Gammaproteobacteria bacterium]